MEIPNSPVEFMHCCLMEQLESLPEGSTIEIPVVVLRDLYVHYRESLDFIKDQQQLINVLIENS